MYDKLQCRTFVYLIHFQYNLFYNLISSSSVCTSLLPDTYARLMRVILLCFCSCFVCLFAFTFFVLFVCRFCCFPFFFSTHKNSYLLLPFFCFLFFNYPATWAGTVFSKDISPFLEGGRCFVITYHGWMKTVPHITDQRTLGVVAGVSVQSHSASKIECLR